MTLRLHRIIQQLHFSSNVNGVLLKFDTNVKQIAHQIPQFNRFSFYFSCENPLEIVAIVCSMRSHRLGFESVWPVRFLLLIDAFLCSSFFRFNFIFLFRFRLESLLFLLRHDYRRLPVQILATTTTTVSRAAMGQCNYVCDSSTALVSRSDTAACGGQKQWCGSMCVWQ